MMGKINIDKLKSFEPIRPERQSDVKGSQNTPIRPQHTSEVSTTKDRVDLSGKAAEVGKLVAQVKELPDVRAEKVADVKARIESGAFDPLNSEIADAIIKDEQI